MKRLARINPPKRMLGAAVAASAMAIASAGPASAAPSPPEPSNPGQACAAIFTNPGAFPVAYEKNLGTPGHENQRTLFLGACGLPS